MEKIQVDIINLRENLNKKLIESGWDTMLSPYINGLSFDHIVNELVNNVNEGKRFTPKFKDIFNAFYECPYDKVKVVMVGQDPYPQLGVADGVAFSCSKKGKIEKSLQYINKAAGTDHVDLRCWANQGVLLLNTAFTCEVNKIGSHYAIWKSFTEYLFENLNRHNQDLIFVLLGKKAEAWSPWLDNVIKINVSHPASAAYRGGEWDCKDLFNLVNEKLEYLEKDRIKW